MIKAVVFDFDGLIIDTESVWYESYKEVFEIYQIEFHWELFVRCVGTDDSVLNQYIDEKVAGLQVTRDDIKRQARELHKVKMKAIPMREGVRDYLNDAKSLGLKIGLASSSTREWVEFFLKKLQIDDYFEVISTGDQVEKVKPDPTLYLRTLEHLEVSAHESVAFEDSSNGAKAATRAGLKCVIVPNELTQFLTFEKYDLRLSSMDEMSLEQVIQRLN
ncbi:HAD family hydrolase [Paenibacillus sp. UNC451MF]|uniref:HAD family hydrolase n=1 Tax=Paenibacillus sp. UNC451MF TaxID=1449063 RepID=UPI00048BC27A|nr:HAD family hydrolase [Paenibacillus sp. UNC451MF]